jgi:hypothetical protein
MPSTGGLGRSAGLLAAAAVFDHNEKQYTTAALLL